MTNNVDTLLDQAFNAFNANNLRVAEGFCREALTLSPHHGDALYLLGLIAYREKAYSVAADLLHQTMELYPDVVNYQLAFAEVLRAQGYLKDALSFYLNFLQDPKVRTEAALIYLALGQNKKAKNYFQEALAQNPNIASAYLGLAQLSRKYKEKENLLLRAFSCEPSENTAYQLTRLYVGKKEWKKAITILKNYLIEPRDWILYGVILEAQGETDKAYEALKKATEQDNYNSSAWVQTGLLLEHQQNWIEAEHAYQKALMLDNTLLPAHEGMANVLMAQGQFPRALEHTRCMIQQNPNHFPSLYKLALLLEQTDDMEEALGLYFRLLILKPKSKALEDHIAHAIQKLAQKKKHLAKRFAKGWVKNFPLSQKAKETWNLVKIILLAIGIGLSFSGNVFANNFQMDLAWESRHAQMGDPISQFNVGKFFEEGQLVPKNFEKAIEYYTKAANQNYTPAKAALGRLFQKMNDYKKALHYYLQAAHENYVAAQLWVSQHYEENGDFNAAYEWLKKAMTILFPDEKDVHSTSPKLEELRQKISETE